MKYRDNTGMLLGCTGMESGRTWQKVQRRIGKVSISTSAGKG